MRSNRLERVNSELRKEIAYVIDHNLRDPQITAMISVTNVECSPDLSSAKVYISSYGDEPKKDVLNRIRGAGSFIRTKLAPRIQMRIIPYLDFFLDNSVEYGNKIDTILSGIKYSTNADDNFGEEDK